MKGQPEVKIPKAKNRNLRFSGLFIMLILAFCSCNKKDPSQEVEVIKVDVKAHTESNLTIKIDTIFPLETTSSSLLGRISKVRFINNKIYVLDRFKTKSLFVFDCDGKFLFKSTLGKGPGEMVEPFAFDVQEGDSTLIVHDQLLGYNYYFSDNLEFQRRLKLDFNVFIFDLTHVGRDTFLVFTNERIEGHPENPKRESYSLYTQGFIKKIQLNTLLTGNILPQTLSHPISKHKHQTLFVVPWDRNIYELIGEQKKVKYLVDFGKLNYSNEELLTLSSIELINLSKQGNRMGVITGIHHTDNIMLIQSFLNSQNRIFIISLINREVTDLEPFIKKNILPRCFVWGITNDNCLLAIVEPSDFLSFVDNNEAYSYLHITTNDNPLVVKIKLDIE